MKPLKSIRYSILFASSFCAFFLFSLSFFFFSSCKKEERKEEMYQEVTIAFDTVCSIQLFTTKTEKETKPIFEEIFAKVKQLESIFSPTMRDSELFKINLANVGENIQLSKEMCYLMEENLKIAKMTDGAFNPCMGTLTSLWRPLLSADKKDNDKMLPSDEALKEALRHTDYSALLLNSKVEDASNEHPADESKKASLCCSLLKTSFLLIDLGASAKGYATDCIKEIIIKNDIEKAIIDFGGNILVVGKKAANKAWGVGIKMPIVHNEERIAGALEVEDKAVVTSGNYERFFEKDGKIYHHIISSKTGMPVENELNAVSIIANSATEADLLSTACFVLGVEAGSTLMKEFPLVSAVFFLKNGEVVEVNNSKSPFHIIDGNLKLR